MDKDPSVKALRESIAHWERMASGDRLPGEGVGHKHCPLCKLFQPEWDTGWPDCYGCPVKRKTGKPYCEGSPYVAVLHALARGAGTYETKEFKAAAAAERDFLKSLLPPNPTQLSKERLKNDPSLSHRMDDPPRI